LITGTPATLHASGVPLVASPGIGVVVCGNARSRALVDAALSFLRSVVPWAVMGSIQ
jgi:hypothetical protein